MADSGELFREDGFPDDNPADVEMSGDESSVEIEVAVAAYTGDDMTPFQEDPIEDIPPRVTYIDYLKSPVIGLLVGQGDQQALLTAHQALLVQSPWFADACSKFSDEVSVSVYPSSLTSRY